MDMQIINSKQQLCTCCMKEHSVKTVRVKEHMTFKNIPVNYEATYYLCDVAEELYADEDMMSANDIVMKNEYRKLVGMLDSNEINAIREKYTISQSDLCTLLGWGGKTITRYESHQVQDKAHDSILKKIDQDPAWFLELLVEARDSFPIEVFQKYYKKASSLFETNRDFYLRKAIEANYAKYRNDKMICGNTALSLDKVVEVIQYFSASKKVSHLYKVKMMKLLWYADMLSYKKRGYAITGLAYQALPMGAVPVGHDTIIGLQGVPCEEVEIGDGTAYHFARKEFGICLFLAEEDREILDVVIDKLGAMTREEIVNFMHKELAYTETPSRGIISFRYAENLQI